MDPLTPQPSSPPPTLPISGPLSLGDLLDRAFRLYRARFWPLLLVAALIMVPVGVITGLFSGQSMTGYMDAVQGLSPDPRATPDQALTSMLVPFDSFLRSSLIQIALLWLATSVVQLALTAQSVAALHNEPLTLRASISPALRRLLPFIGMSILQFLGFVGATVSLLIPVVIVAVAVVATGTFSNNQNTGAIAGLAFVCLFCVGVVLAFLPSVYLSARWIVSAPALYLGAGPLQAMGDSWRLTKGHVWRVIGYTFLLGILSTIVVSIPLSVVQQVLLVALGPAGLAPATAISQGLSSIANVIWMPLFTASIVLLYYDLRVRQEGYDLALRVQQLESQVNPPSTTLP